MQPNLRSISCFVTVLLVGCGGSDGTGPAPGNGGGTTNPPPVRQILTNPSFGQNIVEIFVRRGCTASNCHGAAQSNQLDLRANAAFGDLVNVAAFGEPNQVRVIPGNAQDSYLVVKLEGRQAVGARMPLNGAPLDNIDLTNIRNWIDRGAANN